MAGDEQRPLLLSLALNSACISNHTHYKVWDEIIDPFPNFNGETVEVCEWISIFSNTLSGMWLFIHAGIEVNPCWEKETLVIQGLERQLKSMAIWSQYLAQLEPDMGKGLRSSYTAQSYKKLCHFRHI